MVRENASAGVKCLQCESGRWWSRHYKSSGMSSVHITEAAGGDLLTTAPGPDPYNALTHTGLGKCVCVCSWSVPPPHANMPVRQLWPYIV